MITYKYKREDDTYFEIEQSIKDDALTECPDTGLSCQRVFNAQDADVLFMGKGWNKSEKLRETQKKKRLTDPLYTTDSTYKKMLDDRLEKNHKLANAYEEKKYELKKNL